MGPLTQARRVVVKVGSALLVDAESARVNRAWLETLVEDLLCLRKRGQRVILVSSGAIALGRRRLGLKHGTLRLEESQARLTRALSASTSSAEPTFTTTRRAWVRGTMNENYTHPTCVAQPDDSP